MFKPLLKIIISGLLSIIFLLGLTPGFVAKAAPINSLQIASLFHFSGSRPDNLGITSGQLTPCPSSPNCVSSQSSDPDHKIEAFPIQNSSTQAINHLTNILNNRDNAEIITTESDYLYAEFSSNIMGFVDDVEFWADTDNNVIQVRSASRLGESDLGVNRQRIENLRAEFSSPSS